MRPALSARELSVWRTFLRAHASITRQMEHDLADPAKDHERLLEKYAELQHDYEHADGYTLHAEVERVLSRGGAVVWVNSSGEQTPIHLSPEDVRAALPGR